MALDVGTIGNRTCEVRLNKLLMSPAYADYKSGRVVELLGTFKKACKSLLEMKDEQHRIMFFNIFYRNTLVLVKQIADLTVQSNVCCCLKAYMYEFLKCDHGSVHKKLEVYANSEDTPIWIVDENDNLVVYGEGKILTSLKPGTYSVVFGKDRTETRKFYLRMTKKIKQKPS